MDTFINLLLCVLGYIPGLIHSWYIIAKYPPYTVEKHSKIYYIYQNDLEQGLGGRRHRTNHPSSQPQQPPSIAHHHHHNTYINQQPTGPAHPTYGAIDDTNNPPPYTEVDKSSNAH